MTLLAIFEALVGANAVWETTVGFVAKLKIRAKKIPAVGGRTLKKQAWVILRCIFCLETILETIFNLAIIF